MKENQFFKNRKIEIKIEMFEQTGLNFRIIIFFLSANFKFFNIELMNLKQDYVHICLFFTPKISFKTLFLQILFLINLIMIQIIKFLFDIQKLILNFVVGVIKFFNCIRFKFRFFQLADYFDILIIN